MFVTDDSVHTKKAGDNQSVTHTPRALCQVPGESPQVHGQPSLGQSHCPAMGTGRQFGHEGDSSAIPLDIPGKGEAGHSQDRRTRGVLEGVL